jgi:hypothetical protein
MEFRRGLLCWRRNTDEVLWRGFGEWLGRRDLRSYGGLGCGRLGGWWFLDKDTVLPQVATTITDLIESLADAEGDVQTSGFGDHDKGDVDISDSVHEFHLGETHEIGVVTRQAGIQRVDFREFAIQGLEGGESGSGFDQLMDLLDGFTRLSQRGAVDGDLSVESPLGNHLGEEIDVRRRVACLLGVAGRRSH